MEDLIEKVTDLQRENEELKAELKALKATANK
jgi:cell division septum initiation protein DivIVA